MATLEIEIKTSSLADEIVLSIYRYEDAFFKTFNSCKLCDCSDCCQSLVNKAIT